MNLRAILPYLFSVLLVACVVTVRAEPSGAGPGPTSTAIRQELIALKLLNADGTPASSGAIDGTAGHWDVVEAGDPWWSTGTLRHDGTGDGIVGAIGAVGQSGKRIYLYAGPGDGGSGGEGASLQLNPGGATDGGSAVLSGGSGGVTGKVLLAPRGSTVVEVDTGAVDVTGSLTASTSVVTPLVTVTDRIQSGSATTSDEIRLVMNQGGAGSGLYVRKGNGDYGNLLAGVGAFVSLEVDTYLAAYARLITGNPYLAYSGMVLHNVDSYVTHFGGNNGSAGADTTVGFALEGTEMSDPAAPSANMGRLYFRDNGAGKTQLVVRFPTGAVQVIATEP
jgi:hypothetical protein